MKKYLFLLIVIPIILLSCEDGVKSGNPSSALIDSFYNAYNANNFKEIGDLANSSISDLLVNMLEDNFKSLGKNISHTQYAIKVMTRNGQKQRIVSFKSKYEKAENIIYEKFFIEIETNKILSYVYSGDKKFIDNYETYSTKATEVSFQYYEDLIKDDGYSFLDNIVDKEKIIDAGLKNKYIELLDTRKKMYGNINTYSQININTFLDSAGVSVVQRFECKTDRDKYVYEELWLIERNGEFKIFDYYFAPDYKTLVEN